MARAAFRDNAITHNGLPVSIVPNATVALYVAGTGTATPGTGTPYPGTIYTGPTGGSTLTNPFVTDEHGNIVFYLDAATDLRIEVAGVGMGTLVADWVRVQPAVRDIVTRTTVVNEDDWAVTLQNEHNRGKAFRILDPDDHPWVTAQRSPGGRNVFSINVTNTSVPENNLFLVAESRTDTSVMADFELDNTGGGGTVDSTALRGVGRVSGGSGATRSLEAFTHRLGAPYGTAATNSTWGVGVSVFTNVPGLGPTYNVGIFLNGGAGLIGEVENDAAILVTGPIGWSHGYYQLDSPAQSNRMASIDKVGKIVCGNISPRTDGTFSLGSSNTDAWLAAYVDTFAATANGSAAGPSYTFYSETTSGMFLSSAGVLGWSTVGGNRMALSAAALQLFVPMMLQQKTSMSVASGYDGLFFKSDDYLYRQDSGATVVKMTDASQMATLEATGSTSGPTTTSASYADIPQMTLTFNNCVAGDQLVVDFNGMFSHSSSGGAIVVALKHNSNSEVRPRSANGPTTAGNAFEIATHAVFTATAGTNTVVARWLTSGATATANSTERSIKGRRMPA